MARTGLRYIGDSAVFAFKKTLGQNAFIPIEEIFNLYGKQSGYAELSKEFVQWFFSNHVNNKYNFRLEVENTDFNEEGIFIQPLGDPPQNNRHKTEERQKKSSQIILEQELGEPKEEQAEAGENSGTVKLTSDELQVADSFEDAQEVLAEQAKRRHNQPRATIVENIPEKPMKTDQSQVIRGDDFKKKSSIKSTAVVLDGATPVGVEGVPENMKVAKAPESERAFVLDLPPTGNRDVASRPIVNYGGKSTTPVNPEKKDIDAPKEQVGKGENVMNQPAMAAQEDVRKSVTVDMIVRNQSNDAAVEAINRCKDTTTLKIAAKQLRSSGHNPKLEQAIQRRLALLPPGSME